VRASISVGRSEVTMKRGLAPASPRPGIHSALATTRRLRLQLSRVRPAEVGEAARGPPAALGLVLGPGEVDGDVVDQAGVAGEAEDEVDAVLPRTTPSAPRARSRRRRAAGSRTRGQRVRIWRDDAGDLLDRAGGASMLARRSLAASRWSPQKM
jgi:hypothetical protein